MVNIFLYGIHYFIIKFAIKIKTIFYNFFQIYKKLFVEFEF